MSKSGFTRNEIHRHNGHFDRVAMIRAGLMIQAGLYDIIYSTTATDESKKLADEMLDLAKQLHSSLKIRKTPCLPPNSPPSIVHP